MKGAAFVLGIMGGSLGALITLLGALEGWDSPGARGGLNLRESINLVVPGAGLIGAWKARSDPKLGGWLMLASAIGLIIRLGGWEFARALYYYPEQLLPPMSFLLIPSFWSSLALIMGAVLSFVVARQEESSRFEESDGSDQRAINGFKDDESPLR